MRFATLATFLILSLGGCGQYSRIDESGFTEVKIGGGSKSANSSAPSVKTATLTGGILVYIFSDNYATNVKLADENSTTSIRLPNGSYSFYAFGYASGAPFTGSTKCDVVGGTTPIALTGSAQTIALTLTTAGCANGAFVESGDFLNAASTQFTPLQHANCGTAVTLSTLLSTDSCVGTGFTAAPQAYRYKAPLYVLKDGNFQVIGDGIVGDCHFIPTDGNIHGWTDEKFPVGNSVGRSGVFAFEVETFATTSTCSTAPESPLQTHYFHKGLIFGAYPGGTTQGRTVANTIGTFTRFFLRE